MNWSAANAIFRITSIVGCRQRHGHGRRFKSTRKKRRSTVSRFFDDVVCHVAGDYESAREATMMTAQPQSSRPGTAVLAARMRLAEKASARKENVSHLQGSKDRPASTDRATK